MWFSFLVTLFGAIEMYYPYLEKNIDPKYYGPIFFAIGITAALLRLLTKKPLMD